MCATASQQQSKAVVLFRRQRRCRVDDLCDVLG
jgi:hypothetical protein